MTTLPPIDPDLPRIELDPKYETCRYCHFQMTITHHPDHKEIQIFCYNHQPLRFDYFFVPEKDVWSLSRMIITLPEHFRLVWVKSITMTHFWLQEWDQDKHEKIEYPHWYNIYDKQINNRFENAWVLAQSPERLLKILQMYRGVFS
jgi:hypothetical protein